MIPENPTLTDDSSAFVCDLGTIRIHSNVHRKDTTLDYKEISDIKKLYDYYECKLEKMQVYIKNNTQTHVHKYIRSLNLQLRFYNCLELMHPSMPMIKIGGILNRVDIILTDYNILYVMKISKSFQEGQEELQKEILRLKEVAEERRLARKRFTRILDALKIGVVKHLADKGDLKIEEDLTLELPKRDEAIVEKATPINVDPNKKIHEIMIHFDDISLIIGRTIDSSKDIYTNYLKEWNISQPDEAPFLPYLRSGINGINIYASISYRGSVKVEAHLFRLYVRDLQLKESEEGVKKGVVKEFEYILSNPNVELLKERREGDNYSSFKTNSEFFHTVEQSNLFKESANQLDINFELTPQPQPQQIHLDITVNELVFTLPHNTLAASMNLLDTVSEAIPSKPPVESKTVRAVAGKVVTKDEYKFTLDTKLEGISLLLPVNVIPLLNSIV